MDYAIVTEKEKNILRVWAKGKSKKDCIKKFGAPTSLLTWTQFQESGFKLIKLQK